MVAAAITLFLVGYYWGNQHKNGDFAPPSIQGVLVNPPPELPGFELRDAEAQPFTIDNFEEYWTLLGFCNLSGTPGHLAVTRMIEVYNRVAGDFELQGMLQLVLVSERQDPTLARDFGRLSPALKLLSGEPGEIQRLRASLGAKPRVDSGSNVGDDVPLFLIEPSKRLIALFPGAQSTAAIASDLSAIAEHTAPLYPADD
jgi:hypothetical protein